MSVFVELGMNRHKHADLKLDDVSLENKKLKEQRDMLLSLVKDYVKYEIWEFQDQGFSKEEILDLSILKPYIEAIKEVEGEDYYL